MLRETGHHPAGCGLKPAHRRTFMVRFSRQALHWCELLRHQKIMFFYSFLMAQCWSTVEGFGMQPAYLREIERVGDQGSNRL